MEFDYIHVVSKFFENEVTHLFGFIIRFIYLLDLFNIYLVTFYIVCMSVELFLLKLLVLKRRKSPFKLIKKTEW